MQAGLGIRAPGAPGRAHTKNDEDEPPSATAHAAGSPFNKNLKPLPPVETFAAQDLVTHDKYGLGTVLGVEDEVAVLVDFGPQQVRIPVPCSKLFKL